MREKHTLSATLRGHWSLWVHSPRTIIALAFVVMMTTMYTRGQRAIYEEVGYALHLGEMVFASVNQGFHLLNTSIGFLVMISEIPKRISWQKYALIRQSRGQWLTSLVVFSAIISALFLAAMLLSAALCSLPYAAPGGGWSDLERLAADPDYSYEIQFTSEYIRALSPLAACALAAAVQLGYYMTLTLTVLAFALFDCGNVGVMICVLLVTSHITLLAELFPGIVLPGLYGTLSNIASQAYGDEIGAALRTLGGYGAVMAALIAVMAARVQRMDLRFEGRE